MKEKLKLFRKQKQHDENETVSKLQEHFFKILKWIYKNVTLLLCISATYWISVDNIGNIACSYSDSKYEYLEETLNTHIVENAGVDILAFEEEVDRIDYNYSNYGRNKNRKIKVGLNNGSIEYFNPTITAQLSETFKITSISRNFNSLGTYMHRFYILFYICSIVLGWILHLILEKVLLFIRNIYLKLAKKFSKKPIEQVAEQMQVS